MSQLFRHDATGVFTLEDLHKEKIERKVANISVDLAPLGGRIREQRKKLGLVRGDMAKRLCCAEKHLLEIEVGSIDIGFDLLHKIAGTTGCTLHYLLLGSEPNNDQRRLLEMAETWAKSRDLHVSEILDSLEMAADL